MYVKLYDSANRLRFTVPCTACVLDDSDGLLLLELVGADSENRAVWSHLVKARTERSLTLTNAHFHAGGAQHIIGVVPATKYHKVEQTGRLILLHDGLTRFRYEYLLGGGDDAPSPWFLPALQLRLPIPVLPHWAPTLWRCALADRLLRPAEVSFGPAPAICGSRRRRCCAWLHRKSGPAAGCSASWARSTAATPPAGCVGCWNAMACGAR